MKLSNIGKQYKECMMTFGFWGGNRMFSARLTQRLKLSHKKKTFTLQIPPPRNFCLTVRKNTTDIFLAMEILRPGGEYDFLLQTPYSELLQNSTVIVDAGANIGLFSLLCRSINQNSKIICIEPETENYQILEKNMNPLNGICYKSGLWNKETQLSVIPRDTGEWGFIVCEATVKTDESITAISIPALMKKEGISHIDILKIDIEGSEYEVFDETADEWLDQVYCLIVELHDRIHDGCSERVLHKMASHHFTYHIYGEDYVFLRKQEIME